MEQRNKPKDAEIISRQVVVVVGRPNWYEPAIGIVVHVSLESAVLGQTIGTKPRRPADRK